MPAKKKYLTASPWLRLSKILAGTVGGYAVMLSFHLFLCKFISNEIVIVTSFITGYVLWAFLLLGAFIIKNVMKVWLVYISLSLLFSTLFTIL